jgi:deoxyribose-phosphate aldolase
MKFIKYSTGGTKVEIEISDESTLDEVLGEFTNFLRACGYVIDYNKALDLVDMDQ